MSSRDIDEPSANPGTVWKWAAVAVAACLIAAGFSALQSAPLEDGTEAQAATAFVENHRAAIRDTVVSSDLPCLEVCNVSQGPVRSGTATLEVTCSVKWTDRPCTETRSFSFFLFAIDQISATRQ
jgi:hypothetical protein